MNSLLGIDAEWNPIIIENEEWATLDAERYRELVEEVKNDGVRELLELVRQARVFDLSAGDVEAHFVEYEIPVVAFSSLQSMTKYLGGDDPASRLRNSRGDLEDQAVCCRVRVKSRKDGKACYFPFVVTAQAPPVSLYERPVLAHEMARVKATASSLYDEMAIRLTVFNAGIQEYCREHFPEVLVRTVASYLEEEWQACAAVFDDRGRNEIFSQKYIPLAVQRCMPKLDWWLNDEKKSLNISRTSALIADALSECLARLGYHDASPARPLDPKHWNSVALTAIRHAYRLWQKDPGPFGIAG